jgi:DEAD/DEAH box helicase domain-containing protein
MIVVAVVNAPPKQTSEAQVSPSLLAAFRSVLPDDAPPTATPYVHQNQVFDLLWADREVRLVAGTAAGKTLAVAVPLFEKVFGVEHRIGKVLFLYPTRALLADQRGVLERLIRHYGLGENEIGTVRGGMSHGQLVRALSKPVIVATPDAVYWFFRKNVKYNALLLYGLLQADEVVIDEAHLFSGLALRNLTLFIEKLKLLGQMYLGHAPRVHYLTATANPELQSLNAGTVVPGRSKCGDVVVSFERCEVFDREERFADEARAFVEQGRRRVLIVCNSAKRAHRIFNAITDRRKGAPQAEVPDAFWFQFGLTTIGAALDALQAVNPEAVPLVRSHMRQELPLRTRDVGSAVLRLRAEYVVETLAEYLEARYRQMRRVLYRVARKGNGGLDPVAVTLAMRSAGLDGDCTNLGLDLRQASDLETMLTEADARFTQVMDWIERAIGERDEEGVALPVTDDGRSLTELLRASVFRPQIGFPARLAEELGRYFARTLKLDGRSVVDLEAIDFRHYEGRSISLRRFLAWLDDTLRPDVERELLARKTQHQAVGVWRDAEDGTAVIVYSGSMARYAREGLVELFKDPTVTVPLVLISTSAVEVGVDFDADALVTEECEGSSFLQRFGRVGRRQGVVGAVHVFVSPERYAELERRVQVASPNGRQEVPRESFSELITAVFPQRQYLKSSIYLEALHHLVNEQVGRTGRQLNEVLGRPEVTELAREIRQAELTLAYGLRGTLPQVSLRDEGVSKEPFYILQYVDQRDILPPATPFEVAQVSLFFQELIYASRQGRRVFVDTQKTLERAQAIAYADEMGLRILTQGNPSDSRSLAVQYCVLSQQMRQANFSQDLRRMYAPLNGFPAMAFDCPEMLLAYGDIYLATAVEGGPPEPICDYRNAAVKIPDQWYLVLLGAMSTDEAYHRLARVKALEQEELYLDIDGVELGLNTYGAFVIERQAGACFEVWEGMARP